MFVSDFTTIRGLWQYRNIIEKIRVHSDRPPAFKRGMIAGWDFSNRHSFFFRKLGSGNACCPIDRGFGFGTKFSN
jgi:hypothetical protein